MDEPIEEVLSRVIAADSDPRAVFNLPADCEIHFVGRPILALNPATNNMTAPDRYLRHPLVAGRFFFTLPRPLWGDVYWQLGPASFSDDVVAMEETLSDICDDHSRRAGLWKGRAFPYSMLRRPAPWRPTAAEARLANIDKNQAQLDNTMRIYGEHENDMAKVARGYVGWLLTNLQFLDEHDALFETWAPMVQRWGLDRLGILLPTGVFLPGDDPTTDERWPAYRAAFEEFFGRWRLLGMAAPYLPVPLQPLMSGDFPLSVVPQVMRSAGVFCMPDTFSIPSRDNLRRMLEHALHGSETPEHLTEWMQIIAGDNTAKKTLGRFARIFEVQHYLRVLHHRHGAALNRKATVLKDILASFLDTTASTIHADLQLIRSRLGDDWATRRGAFPYGPF